MYFPNLTFLGVEASRVSKFSVTRIAPPDAVAFTVAIGWIVHSENASKKDLLGDRSREVRFQS
jgi:hypothetical protein